MTLLDTRKSPRLLPILGLLILIAAVGIILFTGASGMSRESIEQRLRQFSDQITSEAAKSGREARFAYGNITMEGWGFNKRATVENVSLEVAEKSVLDVNRWSLSTAKMLAEPDPVTANNLVFVLPEPINVIENSQIKTVVTFSAPLKFTYFNGMVNKTQRIEQNFHFPDKIFLTSAQTAGEPADKTNDVVISYDENPVFTIKSEPATGARDANYAFRDVKIAMGDGSQATIASLSSILTEKPGADKKPVGNYKLMLVDLILRDSERTSHAYTITTNFDYTGDIPSLSMNKMTLTPENSLITLNQLLIASDSFKIKAEGKLMLASDDPLPSGMINVDIDNVQSLINSELVPEASRPSVMDALQKITGQPVGSLTNVTIPVKREKSGMMYIGNVTFEELVASLLANMIRSAPPGAPVAVPPAEQKPADAPPPAPAVNAPPPVVAPAPEAPAPVAKEPVKGAL